VIFVTAGEIEETYKINMIETKWKGNQFAQRVGHRSIKKSQVTVLQVNLGRKCNLACSHCHVEAGPTRQEDISDEAKNHVIELIEKFDQIKTVDLTGGAPEMHNGFKEIVKVARARGKEVIVRTNLTIFFRSGYKDMPEFFAEQGVHVVASLPCYLEDNVDSMRGDGVFRDSIKALQLLNEVGFGKEDNLLLDLVYNPPAPDSADTFKKTADQVILQEAYKKHLKAEFGIVFNQLFTITNLPIGRFKNYLLTKRMHDEYLEFLEEAYNKSTLPFLMCKNQLSVDYDGKVYDCDFNQIEAVDARNTEGKSLTLKDFLDAGSLDIIPHVQLRNFCYGCTAGAGASCGGSLI
jgi:radical SAM/Cys-rich protein